MRLPLRSAILFASLALSLAGNSMADVIYSSLAYPLQRGGTAVIGTTAAVELQQPFPSQNAGQLFEPNANYSITTVTLGVSSDAYDTTGMPLAQFSPNFNVWLYSDQASVETIHGVPVGIFHEPKDPIVEIAQGLVAHRNLGLVTATAAPDTVFVQAGEIRWIVLTPADPYTFMAWGSVNAPPPFARALEVDGTLITPEPASLGLLSLVLFASLPVIWIRRSRHFKQPQL